MNDFSNSTIERSATPILDAITDGLIIDRMPEKAPPGTVVWDGDTYVDDQGVIHGFDQYVHSKEGPLPEWAREHADITRVQPMQQLYTRDGSKRGNATVIRIDIHVTKTPLVLVHVVTDANNYSAYTVEELLEAYEPGDYILKEFPNPLSRQDNGS